MARYLAGLLAVATGLLLTVGDAFLAAWTAEAGDAHDIAARGPFLLAMLVPAFAAGALAITLALAVWLGRRQRWRAAACAAAAVGATAVAVAALYVDPTATVWRVLQPARVALNALGAPLVLTADLLLLGGGLWLLAPRRSQVGDGAPAA